MFCAEIEEPNLSTLKISCTSATIVKCRDSFLGFPDVTVLSQMTEVLHKKSSELHEGTGQTGGSLASIVVSLYGVNFF